MLNFSLNPSGEKKNHIHRERNYLRAIGDQSQTLCIDFLLSVQMELHHSQMTLGLHTQTTEAILLLRRFKTWLISLWFINLFCSTEL